MTKPPPSPSPWSEDTLKGSEQFTALLKAEQERITGKVRLAEDRARANATAALAATGVATVLRTVDTTQPTALLVILIIAILITLALSLDIIRNRDTTSIEISWMLEEQDRLWSVPRPLMEVTRLYQRGYISNIRDLKLLEREKYTLLNRQNLALGITLLTLVIMLIWTAGHVR